MPRDFENDSSRGKSVEVLLQGGFGNQLFQLMYVLSNYQESRICLNAQILRPRVNHAGIPELASAALPPNVHVKYGPRKLGGKVFNLNAVIRLVVNKYVNSDDVQNKLKNSRVCFLVIRILLSLYARKIVNLDAEGIKVSRDKDTFVIGYFQSTWKVTHTEMSSIKSILRNKDSDDDLNPSISKSSEHNILGVHVRRGDYAQNEDFGILAIDYYQRSLSLIESKWEIHSVRIFTEEELTDQDLVKLFSRKYPLEIFTKRDIPSELTTLQKMGECDMLISANSTFSWWGASLIHDQNNVFVPVPWFKSNASFEPPIPEGWNQIEANFIRS